jgi:hypothetical protein
MKQKMMKLPNGTELALPKQSETIRELIDKKRYKGEPVAKLSRKNTLRAMSLLHMYVIQLEGMAKHFEYEWNKLKKEKEDERTGEAEAPSESDI